MPGYTIGTLRKDVERVEGVILLGIDAYPELQEMVGKDVSAGADVTKRGVIP